MIVEILTQCATCGLTGESWAPHGTFGGDCVSIEVVLLVERVADADKTELVPCIGCLIECECG